MTSTDLSPPAPTLRGRAPHLVTLVAVTAVPTLATTMFVPSMTSIADDLRASYAAVQLGLSVFLLVTAFVQLLCGPLSDIYGRRPVLVWTMAIYLAGTAMCIGAPTVEWFLAGRVLQGASAAGLVLGRTVLRDIYERDRAASMIGYTIMAMAVGPMVGPWIGGMIDEAVGWRGTFWLLGAIGLATWLAVLGDLPETNRTLGRPLAAQRAAYRDLLGRRDFWTFAATGSLSAAIYFGFLGGAAQIADRLLGMTPAQYGAWFAFCAGGYMLGNFLSGRFAERVGLGRMILLGAGVSVLGPLATLLSFALGWLHPFALFGWVALVGVGNGMVLPSNVAAGVSVRPDAAGAASGLLGTLQTLSGAAASVVAALVVGDGLRAVPFALTLLLFAVLALASATLAARAIARV